MITTGYQQHFAAGPSQQAADRAADRARTDNHVSRHSTNTILCPETIFTRS